MPRFRRIVLAIGGASAVVLLLASLGGSVMARRGVDMADIPQAIGRYVGSGVPGLQYVVVDAEGRLLDWAGGLAQLAAGVAMTNESTLMAYSMTKTLTAVAVLQLVERGALDVDALLDDILPDTPYRGGGITIRQMLSHTAGLPDPIPLRWAHLSSESDTFDEDAALERVLAEHPRLVSPPGATYRYSNIGYWLLGKVVERVSGLSYPEYVRQEILTPLQIAERTGFRIPEPATHASGYLARFSLLNLAKGFLMERKFWSGYEQGWLRFESHHLDGPAFGGLIGAAGDFARFLQDQLRPQSVLLGPEGRRLLESQQRNDKGLIDMTLGWHVGVSNGVRYLYKEGGGGGFHSEMRLYPSVGIASVVMVNGTEFDSSAFLDRMDESFIRGARRPGRDGEERLNALLSKERATVEFGDQDTNTLGGRVDEPSRSRVGTRGTAPPPGEPAHRVPEDRHHEAEHHRRRLHVRRRSRGP